MRTRTANMHVRRLFTAFISVVSCKLVVVFLLGALLRNIELDFGLDKPARHAERFRRRNDGTPKTCAYC